MIVILLVLGDSGEESGAGWEEIHFRLEINDISVWEGKFVNFTEVSPDQVEILAVEGDVDEAIDLIVMTGLSQLSMTEVYVLLELSVEATFNECLLILDSCTRTHSESYNLLFDIVFLSLIQVHRSIPCECLMIIVGLVAVLVSPIELLDDRLLQWPQLSYLEVQVEHYIEEGWPVGEVDLVVDKLNNWVVDFVAVDVVFSQGESGNGLDKGEERPEGVVHSKLGLLNIRGVLGEIVDGREDIIEVIHLLQLLPK